MLSKRKLFWGLVFLNAITSGIATIYHNGFTSTAFFAFFIGFGVLSVVVIPSVFLFVMIDEWKQRSSDE
jgi:hypothetical protein